MKLLRLALLTLVVVAQIAEAIVLLYQQRAIDAAIEAMHEQDRRVRQVEKACEILPASTHRPANVEQADNGGGPCCLLP